MRIMAIDYGDAHTGIAVSDPTGLLAGFTTVITAYRPEVVAQRVAELALSLIHISLSFNNLGMTKIKIMNLLPAIFLPILLCRIQMCIRDRSARSPARAWPRPRLPSRALPPL